MPLLPTGLAQRLSPSSSLVVSLPEPHPHTVSADGSLTVQDRFVLSLLCPFVYAGPSTGMGMYFSLQKPLCRPLRPEGVPGSAGGLPPSSGAHARPVFGTRHALRVLSRTFQVHLHRPRTSTFEGRTGSFPHVFLALPARTAPCR